METWTPFKKAAQVLLANTLIRPGPGPSFEGVQTFWLGGPFASIELISSIDTKLAPLLGQKPATLLEETEPSRRRAPTSPPHPITRNFSNSQRITANDLESGQIRFPHDAKRFFPSVRQNVEIILKSVNLMGRYDPRNGPDKERSAVLRIGRNALASLIKENEVLRVTTDQTGTQCLDCSFVGGRSSSEKIVTRGPPSTTL